VEWAAYASVTVAVALLLGAAVFFLVRFARSPEGKGFLGEMAVRSVIRTRKAGKRYVINDIVIENNGATSQIDHIVINKNGVFVIETKNYSGKIYGSDDGSVWTAVSARKVSFYSPVKQAEAHALRLRSALGQDGEKLYTVPIAVFAGGDVSAVRSKSCLPIEALGYKLMLPHRLPAYTDEQMKELYGKIKALAAPEEVRKRHISSARYKKELVAHNICPRCGRVLVLRSGENGEFYGCQGYPECDFTKGYVAENENRNV
jgi:hypothetical protein